MASKRSDSPSPTLVACKIASNLARSLAANLRQNAALRETQTRPTGTEYVGTTAGNSRIEVRADGTVMYDGSDEPRSILIQTFKGVLPLPKERYLLGIDEAGIGGESTKPHVGIALISAEIGAELIAQGVRDSKAISSDAEVAQLAEVVRKMAVRAQVIPLPTAQARESYGTLAGKVIGAELRTLSEQGLFVKGLHVRIDKVDETALRAELGNGWNDISPFVEVLHGAERHIEVAAASVLAREASLAHPAPSKPPKSAETEISIEPFSIGPHKASERDQVLAMLRQLKLSYPDIGGWIGEEGSPTGIWAKVEAGGTHSLTVARVGQRVVGISLAQTKNPRNAKLSTFWVDPPFRGFNIGPRLLQNELFRLAKQKTRRVIVTFGHEQFHSLQSFFRKHGFMVDGISPQRYRDNSYEVIMGKRFDYRTIWQADFRTFLENEFFRMVGYEIEPISESSFLAVPKHELWATHQLSPATHYLVHMDDGATPESALPTVRKAAKEHGALPVLGSFTGLPAETSLPSDVLVLDAFEIQGKLFPVHLERPDEQDVIIPIEPGYAQRLFGLSPQTTFSIPGLSLRSDHVYYRVNKGDKGLRRGARVFFYVSGPNHGEIVGFAYLRRIDRGPPKRLHANHGGLGAWDLKDILEHTQGEDAMAYVFDWFQKSPRLVPLAEIKSIRPKFNPITTYRITHAEGDQIIHRGAGK